MFAKQRLYFNQDKTALVAEDDPTAASLYAGVGDEIPTSAAELFGLVDGELSATGDASASEPDAEDAAKAVAAEAAAAAAAATKEAEETAAAEKAATEAAAAEAKAAAEGANKAQQAGANKSGKKG